LEVKKRKEFYTAKLHPFTAPTPSGDGTLESRKKKKLGF